MHKMLIKNRGFTLIELLVVISIIGFLSSIVLASLRSAGDKGADSAIKSNLNNMRAQAELILDTFVNGCPGYRSVCGCAGENPYTRAMFNAATTASGNGSACAVNNPGTAWAAWAALKTNSLRAWCVDNTGDAVEIDKPGGVIYKCR